MDMEYFKTTTLTTSDKQKQNACIMGRKTYFSIPPNFRPLSGRINIILSTNSSLKGELTKGEHVVPNLQAAFELVATDSRLKDKVETLFIIGGNQVYKESMELPATSPFHVDRIHFTLVHAPFQCDVFFPPIDSTQFHLEEEESKCAIREENGVKFQFLVYKRT